MKEIVTLTYSLDPVEIAGFVAVGTVATGEKFPRGKIYRIKIKSPQHRALEKLCWRSNDEDRTRNLFIEYVRTHDSAKFLERFPQWRGLYQDVKQEFEDIRAHVNGIYGSVLRQREEGKINLDQQVKLLEKEKMFKGILLKMLNLGLEDSKPVLLTWPSPLILRLFNEFAKGRKK